MKTKREYEEKLENASKNLGKIMNEASSVIMYSDMLEFVFDTIKSEWSTDAELMTKEFLLVLAKSVLEEDG